MEAYSFKQMRKYRWEIFVFIVKSIGTVYIILLLDFKFEYVMPSTFNTCAVVCKYNSTTEVVVVVDVRQTYLKSGRHLLEGKFVLPDRTSSR